MELRQVPLLYGADKGKLVNKICLPDNFKPANLTIDAKDLVKAEEVKVNYDTASEYLSVW